MSEVQTLSKFRLLSNICDGGAPPDGGQRCLSAAAKQQGRFHTELIETLFDIFERKIQIIN